MIVNYVFVFMLYNNWWKNKKKKKLYNHINAIVYHTELRTANLFFVSWLFVFVIKILHQCLNRAVFVLNWSPVRHKQEPLLVEYCSILKHYLYSKVIWYSKTIHYWKKYLLLKTVHYLENTRYSKTVQYSIWESHSIQGEKSLFAHP